MRQMRKSIMIAIVGALICTLAVGCGKSKKIYTAPDGSTVSTEWDEQGNVVAAN